MAALGHTVQPESGQAVQEQLGGPAQSRQSSSVALTNEVEPVKGKNDVLDQPRIKDTSDTLFEASQQVFLYVPSIYLQMWPM